MGPAGAGPQSGNEVEGSGSELERGTWSQRSKMSSIELTHDPGVDERLSIGSLKYSIPLSSIESVCSAALNVCVRACVLPCVCVCVSIELSLA